MSFDPQLPPDAAAFGQPGPDPGMALAIPEPEQRQPDLPKPEISYAVKLTPEAAHRLGQRVLREVSAFEAAVGQRRLNARTWRDDYELLPADLDGPWENSADLRAPNTRVACSNHATRLNGQFLAVTPLFGAKVLDEQYTAWGPAIEDLMTCKLLEAEWPQAARDVHQELPVVADPWVRTMWVTETRRMPRHVVDFDEDAFQEAAQVTGDGVAAFQYALETDAQGKPKYRLEFVEETVKDGLEFQVIPFEESIFLPPTAKKDADLWAIGEYLCIRGLELEQGAKAGIYRKKAVEDLLRSASQAPRTDTETARDEHTGLDVQDYAPDDPRYLDYECVLLDWWDDLNEDGACEWYWLLVDRRHGQVLQCMVSPYEHGESRYTRMPYIGRTGQLLSASIAEVLATLQDGSTTVLNDLLNIADQIVGMAGNFFYDLRSMLEPGKIRFGPGLPQFVPGSVDGILPMAQFMAPLPPALQSLLMVLEKLKEASDLVSATSNPALGRESEGDKTLGEIRLVLGNAQQVFSDLAQGVGLRWAKVCDQSRWLVAQYGSSYGKVRYAKNAAPGAVVQDPQTGQEMPGAEVWQPGPDGQPMQVPQAGARAYGEIPVEVLRAKVDFEPFGMSGLPDAASRVQRDMLVMEAAQANPVVAGMPDVLAEMFKQILQDSEFPNHEALSAKIDAAMQAMMMAQAMSQQLALAAGLQEGEQGAAEQERAGREDARAQQSHEDGLKTAQQGRDRADLEMLGLGAVPNPNKGVGAGNGKKRP